MLIILTVEKNLSLGLGLYQTLENLPVSYKFVSHCRSRFNEMGVYVTALV